MWHSHRHTCSTARAGRFARENRLYRKPANIPPAVREAPAFTPGRMSRVCALNNTYSRRRYVCVSESSIAFSTPFWNWSVENLYVTHRWSATGFNCISPTGKLISNSLLGSTRLGRRQTDRIVVPVFPHSSRTVAGVVSSGGSKITEIVVSFRIRCGFEAESTMSLAVLWQW